MYEKTANNSLDMAHKASPNEGLALPPYRIWGSSAIAKDLHGFASLDLPGRRYLSCIERRCPSISWLPGLDCTMSNPMELRSLWCRETEAPV